MGRLRGDGDLADFPTTWGGMMMMMMDGWRGLGYVDADADRRTPQHERASEPAKLRNKVLWDSTYTTLYIYH